MFIHIGNNYLLKKGEIIAAFNVQSLMADPKGRKFVTELKQGNKFIDISEGKWASIILTDGPTYVSRISTSTLRSRSGEDIGDMLVSARRPGERKNKKGASLQPRNVAK